MSSDVNSGYHKFDVFYCLYYIRRHTHTHTHSQLFESIFAIEYRRKKVKMCWPTDWLMESEFTVYRLKCAINITEEFSHHLFIYLRIGAFMRTHVLLRIYVGCILALCMKCAQGITAIQFHWQLNKVDLHFSNAHIFQPIRIVSLFITFHNMDSISEWYEQSSQNMTQA